MYARCNCCETYNLVYEKVGQIINCKSCGTLVDTEIKNLTTYKAGNTPEQQKPSPLRVGKPPRSPQLKAEHEAAASYSMDKHFTTDFKK